MVQRGGIWSVLLNGDTASRRASQSVSLRYTTPDFFRTLGIPLLKGRDVRDADGAGTQFVTVVSDSFARRYWPGEDPIGRRFTIAFFERTIVGVVADVRARGLEAPSEPQVYIPYRQIPDGFMTPYAPKDLAIKASVPLDQLVPAVRAIIRRADPQEPISDIRPLAEIVSRETAPRAQQVRVLAAFAGVAVLLAAIGLHGLLMFAVSQRTQEFGVRMALGAQPGDLARSVLAQGAALALAGAVPGLLLAYAAGRSLQALLADVDPSDALTFGVVAMMTIAIALAGSLAAARRAFRLNPVDALRVDA
jgi:ABC-type antimicrobial peptide transport system permease subunit